VDCVDEKIKLEELSPQSYTIFLKMKSLKNINIIAQNWCNKICELKEIEFTDCKEEFIEVYNLVDFLHFREWEKIPPKIVKIEKQKTTQEIEEERERLRQARIKFSELKNSWNITPNPSSCKT
jgi:hypothetical protein